MTNTIHCGVRHIGDDTINQSGRIIEQLLMAENINLMNDGSHTRFCVQTGNMTCLDLTLCSPDVGIYFEWTALGKLFGCDHMPVIISEITVAERQKYHRFNLHRADWKAYKSLTYIPDDDEEHPLE